MNKELNDRYIKELNKYDDHLFRRRDLYARLSGLFVTSCPSAWTLGSRIMVVGRETKAWNIVTENAPYVDLSDYVSRAISTQSAHLDKHIKEKRDRGSTFFNFLRELGAAFGRDNIAWANLHCFSFGNTMPSVRRTPAYRDVINLSEALLKIAIDILSPNVIIFCNGKSSINIRRKFFPTSGENKVCSDWVNFMNDHIAKVQLEKFRLYGKYDCYRINHPSSTAAPKLGYLTDSKVRAFLLQKLIMEMPQ